MPTRSARTRLILAPDDMSPNVVTGRGAIDPIPFPPDATTGVTDWVFFTTGLGGADDEEQARASRGLQHHLQLVARTDGWTRIGVHEHPQLESEPND